MKNLLFSILISWSCGGLAAVPLAVPDRDEIEYPEDDSPSQREIELGKKLFFDPRLSRKKNISCASCHNPDLGFGDGRRVSLGTDGNKVARNSPHLYNLAWAAAFFWDGRATTLEEQALGPIQAPDEMGMTLSEVVSRLWEVPWYVAEFKAIYNSKITPELLARAIASFERSIISDNSPFDRFLKGDAYAMDASAIRGYELFKGKGNCTQCHDGPNLTDNSFHKIGVQSDDVGRGQFVKTKRFHGAVKTPGLRNVTLTAPYMHNGSIGTLEEVIRFYDRGGDSKEGIDPLMKPLNLTEQEIQDLLAFLGALTDPIRIERPELPDWEMPKVAH